MKRAFCEAETNRRTEEQRAEYRNRKEGMGNQAGRKRKRSTGENHARENREEREKKGQRLSSQTRKRSGRKEAEKEGRIPKAKARGKHRWNSCGSETGKDERKQTGSQVHGAGKMAWETRPGIRGEIWEA